MDRPSKILILGAGYGGLAAARTPEAAVRRHGHPPDITLVDRRTQHQLITQLYEVAAATLEPQAAAVPLERLLVQRRISFIHDEVRDIDRTVRRVVLSRGQLAYDFLVIALGSETEFFGIPGLTEHAFRLRWLEEAVTLRHHLAGVLRRVMMEPRPDRRAVLEHVIVGGGGFTGVELITEVADGLRSAIPTPVTGLTAALADPGCCRDGSPPASAPEPFSTALPRHGTLPAPLPAHRRTLDAAYRGMSHCRTE